jgi:hypothetical protein
MKVKSIAVECRYFSRLAGVVDTEQGGEKEPQKVKKFPVL